MDEWIQAIYDETGIPLNEEDLSLAFREGQWWLMLHRYPVLPAGPEPDASSTVDGFTRLALAHGMEQRLGESIPRVMALIEAVGGEQAANVTVSVAHTEGRGSLDSGNGEPVRGWPHFFLRLSAGGFDVEADLNPYECDDPFEWNEVEQQVGVILQVAR